MIILMINPTIKIGNDIMETDNITATNNSPKGVPKMINIRAKNIIITQSKMFSIIHQFHMFLQICLVYKGNIHHVLHE